LIITPMKPCFYVGDMWLSMDGYWCSYGGVFFLIPLLLFLLCLLIFCDISNERDDRWEKVVLLNILGVFLWSTNISRTTSTRPMDQKKNH
jgi:hypothetical protein